MERLVLGPLILIHIAQMCESYQIHYPTMTDTRKAEQRQLANLLNPWYRDVAVGELAGGFVVLAKLVRLKGW